MWAAILLLVGGRFRRSSSAPTPIASWSQPLYDHSEFWVSPFFGVFGLSNENGNRAPVFEAASLAAFVTYLIVGAVVLELLRAGLRTGRSRPYRDARRRHLGATRAT